MQHILTQIDEIGIKNYFSLSKEVVQQMKY